MAQLRFGILERDELPVVAKPLQDMIVDGAETVRDTALLDGELAPADPHLHERIVNGVPGFARAEETSGVVDAHREHPCVQRPKHLFVTGSRWQ